MYDRAETMRTAWAIHRRAEGATFPPFRVLNALRTAWRQAIDAVWAAALARHADLSSHLRAAA
ncbi:MAG: hypothetical protein AAGK02_02535 [Pseudomonadota bacterium]